MLQDSGPCDTWVNLSLPACQDNSRDLDMRSQTNLAMNARSGKNASSSSPTKVLKIMWCLKVMVR